MATLNLSKINREIEQIIKVTISQFANRIFSEAMASLGQPNLIATYDLQITDNGYKVSISTNSNISAYVEFGTGDVNFRALLNRYDGTEKEEVIAEAIKFYVNGKGTMVAKPYLFPAFFKYRDQIVPEIDKRIQKYLDRAKL